MTEEDKWREECRRFILNEDKWPNIVICMKKGDWDKVGPKFGMMKKGDHTTIYDGEWRPPTRLDINGETAHLRSTPQPEDAAHARALRPVSCYNSLDELLDAGWRVD